jgi:hypothetical protein
MKDPIEPIYEEEKDEDDLQELTKEKKPRDIGAFVLHEDFNEANLDQPIEQITGEMTEIEKVFVMDHDFLCLKRQRESNEEFEQNYQRGLDSYIQGDWVQAQMAWNLCVELDPKKQDGALIHMLKLMERTKAQVPDDWKGGYDWDQKLEAPEEELDFGKKDEDSDED